jgi:hypothetical protein
MVGYGNTLTTAKNSVRKQCNSRGQTKIQNAFILFYISTENYYIALPKTIKNENCIENILFNKLQQNCLLAHTPTFKLNDGF